MRVKVNIAGRVVSLDQAEHYIGQLHDKLLKEGFTRNDEEYIAPAGYDLAKFIQMSVKEW